MRITIDVGDTGCPALAIKVDLAHNGVGEHGHAAVRWQEGSSAPTEVNFEPEFAAMPAAAASNGRTAFRLAGA